jgi:hypothetical protein
MADLNDLIVRAQAESGFDSIAFWIRPDGRWSASRHSKHRGGDTRQATADSPLAALRALYDVEPAAAPPAPSLGALG